MSKQRRHDGGPAFPVPGDPFRGMTLRDYFAGQALAAIADKNVQPDVFPIMAEFAYRIADAMLVERLQEREK